MTFQNKLMIMTVLAVAIASIVLSHRRVATLPDRVTSRFGGAVAAWLAVVAGALIVVGIVSHTLLRHVVQIVPLVAALSLLVRRSSVGVSAAVPLFAFWFLVMGAIWLFLLGVARIFTGTFTSSEITLTIIIGLAAVLGLAAAWRPGTSGLTAARLATIVGFALFQFAAMWISVQPFVARR
jgi:hypothetical protein